MIHTTQIHEITCCESGCGVSIYMSDQQYLDYRSRGNSFHCLNGHSQYFTNSDKRKIKNAERRAARLEAQLDQERAHSEHLERRRRAEKAAKTRLKNRVSKGVCPCCNRHFANLAKHMESQHPGYTEGEG